MIRLLLFLQKQSLAFAVYLFGFRIQFLCTSALSEHWAWGWGCDCQANATLLSDSYVTMSHRNRNSWQLQIPHRQGITVEVHSKSGATLSCVWLLVTTFGRTTKFTLKEKDYLMSPTVRSNDSSRGARPGQHSLLTTAQSSHSQWESQSFCHRLLSMLRADSAAMQESYSGWAWPIAQGLLHAKTQSGRASDARASNYDDAGVTRSSGLSKVGASRGVSPTSRKEGGNSTGQSPSRKEGRSNHHHHRTESPTSHSPHRESPTRPKEVLADTRLGVMGSLTLLELWVFCPSVFLKKTLKKKQKNELLMPASSMSSPCGHHYPLLYRFSYLWVCVCV
jgi:hypothetical protein